MKKGIIRRCFVVFLLVCLTISIISPNIALAQPATFTDSGQSLGTSNSLDVALGDLDSDGDLDAFVTNAGNNKVWLNDSGTFTDSGQTLVPGGVSVALGDLDLDGDLDAFVVRNGANKVWFNDAGTFTDSGQALGSSDSRGVALGDIDSDGDLDAFVTQYIDNDTVWLNDGLGAFSDSGQALVSGGSIGGVALGDLDSDGDLDAFLIGLGANTVWFNDGGTFTDSGQALGSSNSYGVALGDIDLDGDLDAFVAEYMHWDTVWLNDGSGIFTNSGQELGSDVGNDVALGDLDSDGDLDAFLANAGSANRVWLNDDGIFTSAQQLGSSNSYGVALGDIDLDGDLDAFVANAGNNKVWLNLSPVRYMYFCDSGQTLGNSYSNGVALGDLDSDGDLDAFVANYGAANRVWLNDGSGTFTDSGQTLGIRKSWDVALGDLDSDGDLDAFVVNVDQQANRVWHNDGSGVFSSVQALGNAFSFDVALGDLDSDGDLDAFVAETPSTVWFNDGLGLSTSFTDSGQTLGLASAWSYGVALGDIDSDGDLDAFVANSGGSKPNTVWLNDGSGTFTDSGQTLGDTLSSSVALGDLDSDGDLDAFVANDYGHADRVWLNDNDGLGTFTDSLQELGSAWSYDVALGDLDSDGDLDAFVANGMGPDRVWLNDGSGVFSRVQALGGSHSRDVALGDLDSDGDLDAFVANDLGQPNKVWNNGAHDYGDAPAPYPTADAYHIVDIGKYLGSVIDYECQALPDDDAIGDDNNNLDDEDGVSFDTMVLCQQADITVTASEAGFLNTWIDFNADGDWDDANEGVFDNYPLSSGANLLSFTVPCHAVAGETFARFRFSTDNSINSYDGYALSGEIEDYKIEIKTEELPPSPSLAVGGNVYPVNKMSLLLPWIALALAIIALGILLIHRRVHIYK